jgi:hypothetical protein
MNTALLRTFFGGPSAPRFFQMQSDFDFSIFPRRGVKFKEKEVDTFLPSSDFCRIEKEGKPGSVADHLAEATGFVFQRVMGRFHDKKPGRFSTSSWK